MIAIKKWLRFSKAKKNSPLQVAGNEAALWTEIKSNFRERPLLLISCFYLLSLALACFSSPFWISRAWDAVHFVGEAVPPSAQYWLGSDDLGRDLLARLLYGGQISLSVGLLSTAVSVLIGMSYGAISGYFGGALDLWMMRLVDFLYCLPYYFVIVLIMVLFSVQSLTLLFLILAMFQWLGMARVVRGQILSLKEREFVLALTAMGASPPRIIFRHMIPNIFPLALVYATLMIPSVMMQEAFLSFIGIPFQVLGTDGVHKPVASWGVLISEGARMFETAPWLLFFPAFFFSTTLLAIHFIGDGLRDALDPSLARGKA